MSNRRMVVFARMQTVLSVVSLLFSVVYLLLLALNIVELSTEENDLGQALGMVFGIVFFMFFVVVQGVLCGFMLIESRVVCKSANTDKLPRKLIVTGCIVKFICAAAALFMTVLFVSIGVIYCGISAAIFTAVLIAMGIGSLIILRSKFDSMSKLDS